MQSMITPRVLAMVGLSAALALSGCSPAVATAPPSPLSDADKAFIDDLFVPFSGTNPGAAVLILKGDDILLCKGYGLADVRDNTAVDCDTRFNLASTSKQFTAMAALKLIDQGKLSLDDTLADVFPDFPDYGESITIQHLLTHTAGLKSYDALEAESSGRFVADADVVDFLKTQEAASYPPGSKFEYSNSGYAVLAEVVARASGQPYEDFMAAEIFGPSNMAGSFFLSNHPEITDRALGYDMSKGTPRYEEDYYASRIKGTGSIYASANGLRGWHEALDAGTLISAPLQADAYTAQPGTDGQYGYGWFIPEGRAGQLVEHGGAGLGFISYTVKDLEDDITVSILANRSRVWPNIPGTDIYSRAYALLSLATDGDEPMPDMADLGVVEEEAKGE